MPIMKAAFFNSLLKGEYRTDAEIQNVMKQVNLNLKGCNYSVVIININGFYININPDVVKELAINRIIVENTILQNLHNGYVHFIDENKLALILSYDNVNPQECSLELKEKVDEISNKLQEEYNLIVMFAAGEIRSELLHLVQSYEQAVKVLEYKLMKRDSSVLWYHEIPIKGDGYYYPIDTEARIMNVVKSGDNYTVQGYLKNIYEENFVKRDLSVDMIIKLFGDMRDTLYKIIHEIEEHKVFKEKVDRLKFSDNTEEVFNAFALIYEELCLNSVRLKKDSENQLIKDIVDYIRQNYMDINFSPVLVASKFAISEAYFPHFFKSETGVTFSSVLENIRIEKACELLHTDLAIKDIAERVGYSGDKTFRRAFKRVKGVSPSEFAGRK
jgi:two-component system, response regulator YesN